MQVCFAGAGPLSKSALQDRRLAAALAATVLGSSLHRQGQYPPAWFPSCCCANHGPGVNQ